MLIDRQIFKVADSGLIFFICGSMTYRAAWLLGKKKKAVLEHFFFFLILLPVLAYKRQPIKNE